MTESYIIQSDLEQQEFTGKFVDSDKKNNRNSNNLNNKSMSSKIIINVYDTQYPVVKFVAKKLIKWQLDQNTPLDSASPTFDICWTDNAVKQEFLSKMQPHQKINHFPGMSVISRKNNLGRNLMKLKKKEPQQYGFFPVTFVLPLDYHDLKQYCQNRKPGKSQTFIVKPQASSQGKGIFLTRNIQRIKHGERCVVQRYLHNPYLIQNLKFDLRIYVLVTGTDPLRIYVYQQGLARFATQVYQPPRADNLDDICMHLTNYAINKQSPNFIFNESAAKMNVGHKRSLTSVYEYLQSQGHDIQDLKQKINDIFIKTLISGQPVLSSTYKSCQPTNFANNMCFQLLGFDIILDSKLRPILLEVNHTPSFSTDTPLDCHIKKKLIKDTMNFINMNQKLKQQLKLKWQQQTQQRITTGKRKKYSQQEKQRLIQKAFKQRNKWDSKQANLGNFKKIYPIIIGKDNNQKNLSSKQKQLILGLKKKYDKCLEYAQQIHEIYNNGSYTNNNSHNIQKKQNNLIANDLNANLIKKNPSLVVSNGINNLGNQKKNISKSHKDVIINKLNNLNNNKNKLAMSTLDVSMTTFTINTNKQNNKMHNSNNKLKQCQECKSDKNQKCKNKEKKSKKKHVKLINDQNWNRRYGEGNEWEDGQSLTKLFKNQNLRNAISKDEKGYENKNGKQIKKMIIISSKRINNQVQNQ